MKIFITMFFLLTPLLLLSSVEANAQEANDQTVINMVNKLQQKVLLTEDQKNQIINIIRSDNSENFSNARGRVEELLDQRQKAKYDIIKADWWKVLTREIKAQ